MSVNTESEPSPEGSSATSSPISWNRPRWADGRLISPRDDGIAVWIKAASWCLAGIGAVLFGLTGIPTSAKMPSAALVVVLLVALAAGTARMANARAISLAERAPLNVSLNEYAPLDPASPASPWRPARWPDGRYVAPGDFVSVVAGFVIGITLALTAWTLGRMGAPSVDIASWRGSLGSLLMLPSTIVGFVSSRRLKALAAEDAAAGRDMREARGGTSATTSTTPGH